MESGVDHDSEQDSEDEEDTKGRGMDISLLGRGILSQQGEVQVSDPTDHLPDLRRLRSQGDGKIDEVEDETNEEEFDRPSTKRKADTPESIQKLKRTRNTERQWNFQRTGMHGI